MTFRGVFAAFVAVLFVSGVVQSVAAQQVYTVGNGGGWVVVPTNGPSGTFYDQQFANISLFVGDVLLFPYTAPAHNVYTVTQAAFSSCDTSNPITTNTTSNANIILTTAGPNYFICGVPTHCGLGMHLQVNVLASASSPAATPTAPPTTSPVTAPNPPPAGVPAPVPSTPSAPTPLPSTTPTPTPLPSTTPTPTPVSAPTPTAGTPTPAPTTATTPTPASSTAPSIAPTATPTSPSTGGEGPAEGPSAPGPGTGDQENSASGFQAVPAIVVATILAACSALVF